MAKKTVGGVQALNVEDHLSTLFDNRLGERICGVGRYSGRDGHVNDPKAFDPANTKTALLFEIVLKVFTDIGAIGINRGTRFGNCTGYQMPENSNKCGESMEPPKRWLWNGMRKT